MFTVYHFQYEVNCMFFYILVKLNGCMKECMSYLINNRWDANVNYVD